MRGSESITNGANTIDSREVIDRIAYLEDEAEANRQRARRGRYLVDAYVAEYGWDGEFAVRDILADLMHYCCAVGPSFEIELSSARGHFQCESVTHAP
jgi:hypothetical protein